jgi:pyruvate dehydrogenase phosphatase
LAPITRGAITAVDRIVLSAFKSIEAEYLQKVRESYRLGFGEVAKVGCCALVALQRGDELVLANAGDCRAVLGSSPPPAEAASGKFLATRLTHDHNARMPLELLTLQREHPGEKDVVVCKTPHACYVKGRLQLTRALGDAYLKYPEFNQPGTHRGRHIVEPYTPPYVKSTPDIHHVKLGTNDRFVVLASDGLWDFLSDEDAVAVVEQCLRDGTADKAGEALVQCALEVAAAECGMTLQQLKGLPQGSSRRGRHDDTTAVVLYF